MDSRILSSPRHKQAGHFNAMGLFSGLLSFAELERRIEHLATPPDRGSAFEVLAEAYLNTQKIIQSTDVWPEAALPADVARQLILPLPDMGVDGVYRTLGGDYAAYQVKFITGRKPLTWSELSTFVGLAHRADLKVLFTNSNEVLEAGTDRRDVFCIRGADLDRLTKDDFAAIDTWLRGGMVERELWRPRRQQEEPLERRDRPTTLGFDWGPPTSAWERMFGELVRYKERHGDCNVPAIWPENRQLGIWVSCQRHARDALSEEHRGRLTALEFDWDPQSTFWERMFGELARYCEQHGDCNVPAKWPENRQLGIWVSCQRQYAKLSDERRQRLEAIGFRL